MSIQTPPAATRPSALLREAFTAVGSRDLERLVALFDEATVVEFLALGETVHGRTALRGFFGELFTALPDLEVDVEAIDDLDEVTAVGRWRITGTLTGGPFRGIEPTGRPLDVRGVDVMRFEGPVLRHNTVYFDGLSFARQLGLLPAADSAADRAMLAAFNALTRVRTAIGTRLGSGRRGASAR